MQFIGIDPGLDGALVVIDFDGSEKIVTSFVTPTINPKPKIVKGKKKSGGKRAYDLPEMRDLLDRDPAHTFAMLEKSQAMPPTLHGRPQGTASSFAIGVGYGVWQGLLTGLGISFEVVHPRRWQSVVCRQVAGDTKARALIAAKRLFPRLDLRKSERCTKAHDGIVDALLIAEYALRSR